MALVNEAAATQGQNPIGYFNPVLYVLAQGPGYLASFHDITEGNNGFFSGDPWFVPYFDAEPGYDLVTGWGSPAGSELVSVLAPSISSSFQLTASPTNLVIQPGDSGISTVTVNPTSGFSATVALSTDTLPPGLSVAFSQNPVTTTTVITVTADASASRGSYLLKVKGSSTGVSEIVYLAVQVNAPGFMLSSARSTVMMAPGTSSSAELEFFDFVGFQGIAGLTITSPLPPGVTAVLNPNTAAISSNVNPPLPSGVSYINFIAEDTAPLSETSVAVRAQSGSEQDSRTVHLEITPPLYRLDVQPIPTHLVQGSSIQTTVTAFPYGKFGDDPIVLENYSALPPGVTVSFDPQVIHVGQSSTMTIAATASASLGPVYISASGDDSNIFTGYVFGWGVNVEAPPGNLKYEIQASPSPYVVPQSGSYTAHYAVLQENGFNEPVSITASSAPPPPPGVSLTLGPADSTGSRDATYSSPANVPAGIWQCSGYASAGTDYEPISVYLVLEPTLPFTMGTQENAITLMPGASASTPVSIRLASGYSGSVVLSTNGLPAGISASFDADVTQADTTLHLAADASVPGGSYFVNVSGSANGQTVVRTIPVQIGGAITPTPVISLPAGTYPPGQSVTISDTAPGAAIYYTTNGSTPTTSSTIYIGPITLSSTGKLQAIAVVAGYSQSAVASAAYIVAGPASMPTFNPAGGTYASTQSVTISDEAPWPIIYYTTDGSRPTTSSTIYNGPITVSSSVTIRAIATGNNRSQSEVASATYIIGVPAAMPTFSVTPGTYTTPLTVAISDSTPGVTIYYTTNGTTPTTSSSVYSGPITVSSSQTIEAMASGNSYSDSAVASATYTITPPAATPTFSPAAGTYNSVQTVAISTTTPNATIYYTTDGTTPTTSSSIYEGIISVASTETVEAVAIASGYSLSAIGSAAYTIVLPYVPPISAPAATKFNSVAVGTPSQPIALTFRFNQASTIGMPEVLTQGAAGEDFTDAGDDTCSAGSYQANATCVVNVILTPKHPGARYGAVALRDGLGNILATAYLYGTGTGPQVAFSPGVQSTLGSGFNYSQGVAVDGRDNVFVAGGSNIEAVYEIEASGGAVTTLGGGFGLPTGVAVDGGGNLYVSDWVNQAVYKMPSGCISESCVTSLGGAFAFGSPAGVAVDGSGNVFVADANSQAVYEMNSGCTTPSCVTSLGGGFIQPRGVAVDGSGNVFVADAVNDAVYEMPASCTSALYSTSGCTVSSLGGGFGWPTGVAGKYYESGCSVSILSGTFHSPNSVAVDGGGNVFLDDPFGSAIYELNLSSLPTLSFATTLVGSKSSDGPKAITIANNGNALLTFTGMSAPADFLSAGGTTCAAGSQVLAGASCNLSIEFEPTVSGSLSESFVLTDNNLNAAGATQSIGLTGTGVPLPPSFSIPAGSYLTSQTVALSDNTPGVTIHYTADGTTPSASSATYTEPIWVNASETILAIAISDGGLQSAVASATYTITPPAAAPTFSVTPGTYTTTQTVGISESTAGVTIYYTTNGTTPTTSSSVYSGPITVSSTQTIEAMASGNGYSASAVASATYTITPPAAAPTFSVTPGTHTTTQTVAISDATAGVTIYYTTNGTTPTTSSSVYSGPITVSSTQTIEAVASGNGYSASAVASATYTINIPNLGPSIASLSPAYTAAGSSAFQLTITGGGFVSGSTIYWGNTALSTQFASATQLTAQVPAADIASAGTASIAVQNPRGGTSDTLQFEVDSTSPGSSSAPSFKTASASVSAGNTASYLVTLPSTASGVTVRCLNLPAEATCSYSAASGAVSIATSSSTPVGNYQVTTVFNETQSVSVGFVLAPFFLLPLLLLRRKLFANGAWFAACLVVVLTLGAIAATGCGGGGSTPVQSSPTTHQVTSSGVVTLIVK
jgi:hypothetical protein